MLKCFALSIAAYILPSFPLGYFWHLVTFAENYKALALFRTDVVIPLGLLSMAIQATIYALIYPRLFNTSRDAWLKSAAQFALAFGTLAWSLTVLPVAAKYNMASTPDFMMLETGYTILQYAVVSPLIALAWRRAPHPRP